MELTLLDYGVLALALGSAVAGLFIGFSGALAFLAGLTVAAAAGFFAWPVSADWFANVWVRSLVVGIGSLLVFGLVRFIVKKCVHGLVAQPGDALLGFLSAAVAGSALALGVAWGLLILFPENSDLRSLLLERVLVLIGR